MFEDHCGCYNKLEVALLIKTVSKAGTEDIIVIQKRDMTDILITWFLLKWYYNKVPNTNANWLTTVVRMIWESISQCGLLMHGTILLRCVEFVNLFKNLLLDKYSANVCAECALLTQPCWWYRPPDVQRSATVPSQCLRHVRGTAWRRLSGMHYHWRRSIASWRLYFSCRHLTMIRPSWLYCTV